MDKLFSIKDSLQDGLLVLPHLLSGFFFFIGILTMNIGMLCLALAHFFIVPSISFFANNEWSIWAGGGVNIGGIAYSFIPAIGILACLINVTSLSSISSILLPIMYLVKAVLPLISDKYDSKMPLFDSINPYVWVNGKIEKKHAATIDLCYLSPEERLSGDQRRSPSGWLIHVLFFFGFLLANASTLYAQPTPTITPTKDSRINASSKEQLDIRVNNRKIITGSIIGLSIVSLGLLLWFRYSLSPCEDTIYESLFPLSVTLLLGVAFYTTLTDSCGIPASDILGLVQGFISPNAVDNPIVCIGSDPGPLRQ